MTGDEEYPHVEGRNRPDPGELEGHVSVMKADGSEARVGLEALQDELNQKPDCIVFDCHAPGTEPVTLHFGASEVKTWQCRAHEEKGESGVLRGLDLPIWEFRHEQEEGSA